MQINGWRQLVLTFAALTVPASGSAQTEPATECYDAIVEARIVAQLPYPVDEDPSSGDIIMESPWFLDLHVKHVVEGSANKGGLTVLAMMHTFYRRHLGEQRWYLRRNSIGGFNLLRGAADDGSKRCAPSTPPMRSYLRPSPGKSLADFRRKAETTARAYR
jgi:hypothetical protein